MQSYATGHVAFIYETLADRIKVLAEYFNEGIARNEQCIFAAAGPIDHAIDGLQAAGLDARAAIDKGALQVLEMHETYLPHGKFVADYMLANVANFINDAKTHGYSGLRTAGEMRWINLFPDLLPDATQYESSLNGLCDDHRNFIGLCLYPLVQDSTDTLKAAIQTHPALIYDGQLRINPYATTRENAAAVPDDLDSLKQLLKSL